MDLIKTHPQPYSTGELRFMLRMKPFKSIHVPENFDWESVPWEYFQPQKEKEADAENGVDEEQTSADVYHLQYILACCSILIYFCDRNKKPWRKPPITSPKPEGTMSYSIKCVQVSLDRFFARKCIRMSVSNLLLCFYFTEPNYGVNRI